MTTSDLSTTSAAQGVCILGKLLASIDDEFRALVLFEKLRELSSVSAVRLLGCALRSAARQDLDARIVVDTLSLGIATGRIPISFTFTWSQAAGELNDDDVQSALASTLGRSTLAKKNVGPRASLGHRRAVARTAVGPKLDQLMLDNDALVVERTMQNPRMTEEKVVRLSARRALPAHIVEVIMVSSFGKRIAVRRALAKNPATPPALAVRIVAVLPRVELRAIARDTSVAPAVREAAARILPPTR